MTREDSILSKTWFTDDGRVLTAEEITTDHLHALRGYLRSKLPVDSEIHRLQIACADWMASYTAGKHAVTDEMDHDVFSAGWLQIVEEEINRR